jgi:hypothetical protein
MKKTILSFLLVFSAALAQAQFTVTGSETFFIKSGETISIDGLTLMPTADLTLSNTAMTISTTTVNPIGAGQTHIPKVYKFSNTTAAFTGSIRFDYSSVAGSISSTTGLTLHYHNGAAWQNPVAGTVSTTANFFETTGTFSSTAGLNEITLSAASGPLPVTWLAFTATKKENTSVLNWSTATEQNTQDFLVQHSAGSGDWKTLGTVKAAGNATSRKDYTFTHYTPIPGYNYYRLIQRDQDGQFSYSKVVSVVMNKEDIKLRAFPNPVQDGRLNVLLKEPVQVRLFDASGRQVLTQRLNAGLQTLNVSGLQGGVYYLKAGVETVAVIIK